MRLRPAAAPQRVLLRRTEEEETERDEPKERYEGISCMVKKPFRCLVGMKSNEDMDPALRRYQYQYSPPGSFADAVGIETIHDEKPKKSKSRRTKEKWPVELKEASHASGVTPLSEHRLETNAANEESSSPNGNIFENALFFRNHSFEEPKESPTVSLFARNQFFEGPPHDMDALPQLETKRSLGLFATNRSQSFEEAPPPNLDEFPQLEKKRSFADAIPTPNKSDPLDRDSIRDVQKALREMERKLTAADTEGKRVSRSKVMKALLTVVDQLDEDYDYSPEVKVITDRPSSSLSLDGTLSPPSVTSNDGLLSPPVVTRNNVVSRTTSPEANVISSQMSPSTMVFSSHKSLGTTVPNGRASPQKSKSEMTPTEELYRNWAGPSFDANTKQCVETVPKLENDAKSPQVQSRVVACDVPWQGKPSPVAKTDEVKAATTAETEEAVYISSDESSNDSVDSSRSSNDASTEHETLFSGESTLMSEETKTTKGTFAHAVAPRRKLTSGFDDFFHLDMNDPVVKAGVKDALCDLMWIPSIPNSPKIEESKKSIPKSAASPKIEEPKKNISKSTVSASPKKQMLEKLRAESLDWHKEEENESELAYMYNYEDSTADTTRSSPPRQKTRDRSWWRRSRSLKPPSKDTPNVVKPIEHQTKVTVTTSDQWKEILY